MLAKPGKRMNQVLYMNFVIGSIRKYWDNVGANCSFKHPPDLTNTLLLTTDGDTSFDFKDVDVLVDSMVSSCRAFRMLPECVEWFHAYLLNCRLDNES